MAADPLGLLLLAGGTALDIFGQYQQAQSQQASLLYQAEQLRQDAMLIEVRGRIDARRHRKQTEKMIGSIVRDFAKGGVDVSGGSPLLALQETARESALDLYWMQQATSISAARTRGGVEQLENQAKDVMAAAHIGAATSAIGAFAQAAQSFGPIEIDAPRAEGGVLRSTLPETRYQSPEYFGPVIPGTRTEPGRLQLNARGLPPMKGIGRSFRNPARTNRGPSILGPRR